MNLLKWFGPKPGVVPPFDDSDAEKQVVKERLTEVQQRLRALSAEADVLQGNLGDAIEDI